jgi:hypothetical protein
MQLLVAKKPRYLLNSFRICEEIVVAKEYEGLRDRFDLFDDPLGGSNLAISI